jgi:hypothetical protein
MELWAGCIAGALEENTYRHLLAEAGFLNVDVEVTRIYQAEDLAAGECCDSLASQAGFLELGASGGRLVSAFVRATKPVAAQHVGACRGETVAATSSGCGCR